MLLPYLIAFVLSACSIIYELSLARIMQSISAHGMLWYCLTIGVYVCSLGFGTLFYERLARRSTARKVFLTVELYLAALGALSILIILMGHSLYRLQIHNLAVDFMHDNSLATARMYLQKKEVMFTVLGILSQILPALIGFLSGC